MLSSLVLLQGLLLLLVVLVQGLLLLQRVLLLLLCLLLLLQLLQQHTHALLQASIGAKPVRQPAGKLLRPSLLLLAITITVLASWLLLQLLLLHLLMHPSQCHCCSHSRTCLHPHEVATTSPLLAMHTGSHLATRPLLDTRPSLFPSLCQCRCCQGLQQLPRQQVQALIPPGAIHILYCCCCCCCLQATTCLLAHSQGGQLLHGGRGKACYGLPCSSSSCGCCSKTVPE
jgi:hypothetical protein